MAFLPFVVSSKFGWRLMSGSEPNAPEFRLQALLSSIKMKYFLSPPAAEDLLH